ncbi:MAG: C25 family cysteine peptidase [Candidatus Promineifilaceae bacterium]
MLAKNGRLLILLLALILLTGQGKPTYSAELTANPEPQISLLPDGVQVVWPTPELVETGQPDGRFTLTLPTFNDDLTAALLLALPPEGDPTLAFAESGAGELLANTITYAPAAGPVFSLDEVGVLRGVRLARLTYRPIQPAGDGLRIVNLATATIQFHSPPGLARPAAAVPDLLQTAVAQQIINPSQLLIAPTAAQPEKPAIADPAVFIEVSEPGMTAVSFTDLQSAGFPVGTVNPTNLQLWHDGQPRPLDWFGDGDAQFEPGESFRFYAAPWFSRWQANDVYKLTAGSSPGSRVVGQAASPNGLTTGTLTLTAVAEQNNLYTPDCLCGQLPAGRDGDRWVWEDLRQPGRPSGSYLINLSYVNKSQPAQLTLWTIGLTALDANPDHRLNLSFNGTSLGSVSWDGKTAVTRTLTLPASSLQASSALNLAIPAVPGVEIDGQWLDAFAIRYSYDGSQTAAAEQLFVQGAAARRAYTVQLGSSAGLRLYDVSNPAAPAVLSSLSWQDGRISWGDPDAAGHSYLVTNSSSLHTPAAVRLPRNTLTASADYLIISPASFIPTLTPLVNLRRSQGLTVQVMDLQAIYDGWGNGRLSPEAIRSYLSDRYHNSLSAPQFVLLVGDGTIDPKQYRADSQFTWLPPYLANADPWVGEVAADNRYVAVDGSDFLPDMMIGRLPVNSLAEAQTVVSKIVGYETEPFFGDWNGRITFIADDTDAAGNFAAHAASLRQAYVADPWRANSLSYSPALLSETEMQTAVRQSWQNGAGLLVYTGHSSIHQWGAERFFHLDDVANLSNGARLPVVLEMTCFTGSFAQPFWNTLDEALLRQPNGGAVAVWGATGLGVGTGHDALAGGFLQTVIGADEVRVGTAVLAGKLNLLTHKPANLDLLDTFTLFGDPAMQYNTDFWAGIPTYLPLVSR